MLHRNIQNMMDINVDSLQWSIISLINKLLVVVLKMKKQHPLNLIPVAKVSDRNRELAEELQRTNY